MSKRAANSHPRVAANVGLLLLYSTFGMPFVLRAADPTGSMGGRVVDPTGAVVVNAKVTATVVATGLKRETATAVDGGYIFPLLPAGVYSLAVEASGFSRFEQRGIEVRANVNSTVPITL